MTLACFCFGTYQKDLTGLWLVINYTKMGVQKKLD